MEIQAVVFVGTKKSGKTTTIENLIKELTKRGYNVAAMKHVSETEFTIDTPGKDTWRFAQSGARTIVSVAAKEVVTIEKVSFDMVETDQLIGRLKGNDIVLIEGFKKRLARADFPKIAIVKSREEAESAIELYKPILAFSGPYNTQKITSCVPYVNAMRNPEKLAELIEEKLLKKYC